MIALLLAMSIPVGEQPTKIEVDHLILDHKYSEDWSTLEYRVLWLINFDAGDMVCHGYILLSPEQYVGREKGKFVYRWRKRYRSTTGHNLYEVRAFTYQEVSSNFDAECKKFFKRGNPQYFRGKAR